MQEYCKSPPEANLGPCQKGFQIIFFRPATNLPTQPPVQHSNAETCLRSQKCNLAIMTILCYVQAMWQFWGVHAYFCSSVTLHPQNARKWRNDYLHVLPLFSMFHLLPQSWNLRDETHISVSVPKHRLVSITNIRGLEAGERCLWCDP